MTTVFLRALEADDKPAALLAAIRDPEAARGRTRFEVDAAQLSSVPRSPFGYWVSSRFRQLFVDFHPFHGEGREARFGASPKDRFRFVLAAWEARPAKRGASWLLLAKGGESRPYYSDVHLLVKWRNDAAELKAHLSAYRDSRGWGQQWSASLNAVERYGSPGLTWTLRTQGGLSLRVMPSGCVFADKGPAAFVEGDDVGLLLALMAVLNSTVFRRLVDMQMAFGSYEVGVIQHTPVPPLTGPHRTILATLAHRAWSLRRSFDTRTETSHALALPALLQIPASTLADHAAVWADRVRATNEELAAIQAKIDEMCFDLYGIDEVDRRAITAGFGNSGGLAESEDEAGDAAPGDAEGEDDDQAEAAGRADAPGLTAELLSWAVGVAFGRFDLRLATGERQPPPEPDPFDPLPVCSPGMLTGDDGLPLAVPPPGYPLAFPADGVLVDDTGHASDLTARVREVFGAVFGGEADARWQEAAELVAPQHRDLRRWLAREYFGLHLRAYSKSRRRAPIYWQLGTASGSYSVWLYYHRFTRDTLFTVFNDYVTPKLRHEERRLTGLVQEVGPHPTPSQRRDIAAQEAFVEEMRAFREELARVAPLWDPDLNDGVIINFAPLWRLVPQHKAWQREVKTCWDKLAAGTYDWAHLAMHLWPERVVPKCATDRSLAIAHGLEDVFWAEGDDGKWRPREVPAETVRGLVGERSSEAVKAARDSLFSAPTVTGGSTTRRAKGDAA